jgi:tetratricopeptide (TPR) repeat protein
MFRRLLLCLAFASGAAYADEDAFCPNYASDFGAQMLAAQASKAPEAAIRSLFRDTSRAVTRCPSTKSIAYMYLRLAELGQGTTRGTPSAAVTEEWHKLAKELAVRFPGSVRIATVEARALGTVDAARQALRIDPGYAPALVALAVALLNAKQVEAAATIANVSDLTVLSDGYSTLARILLAKNDLPGAIHAAKRSLSGGRAMKIEPDGGSRVPFYQANEVLGLAYLKTGKYALAAHALMQAQPGSGAAAVLLENPEPKLRAEIERLSPRNAH